VPRLRRPAYGGVWAFGQDGAYLAMIRLPEILTEWAFGEPD
jgi:hypothetical protein